MALELKGDTQALQAVATGAQGYQNYSGIKGGALFKAEAGIGFSTSENQQNSSYATSQQNNLKAGGNVNLTSTNGDIHLQNTQVKAEDKINLDSAKNIVLESGQSQNKADLKMPANERMVNVNVNGYVFSVTRDGKTGKISNAFPTIPNSDSRKPTIPPQHKAKEGNL